MANRDAQLSKMNRRKFLKSVGASGAGLGILSGVIGVGGSLYSFGDSIEIRLFQTEKVSQYLEEEGLGKDFWVRTIAYRIPRIYHWGFEELENVNVSIGDLDVSIDTTESVPKSTASGVKQIVNWGKKAESNPEIKTVKHSNVLIRNYDLEKYNYAGFGLSGIMPSCCRLYNGYASMWIDPEKTEVEELTPLAAHEIGHNLGLMHSYGSNVENGTGEKGDSVMLSRRYAESHDENIFGEEIEFTGKASTRFNDELDISNLRI